MALAAASIVVACVDLSAPKGPASISFIHLPAAFVVRGDTMRDSAGALSPPAVTEFDAGGHPIAGTPPQFFITDSAPAAHFDPVTGALVGDRLGVVHLIAQVGALQTPAAPVFVTVAPESLFKGTGAKDTIFAPVSQDTTRVGSSTMPVIVHGVGDTAVQGVVVHYTLTRTLASNSATHPAVFIHDATGKPNNADTTDASLGQANRLLLEVRANLLADVAVATGQKVDSVIVQAAAFYKGQPIAGSPVTFVFHVVGTLAQQ